MRDADSEIRRELVPGERIIWTGQARQGIVLRPMDAFMIPFSILWCGFAVFWLVTAASSGAPLPFVLFGVPFVAVGLYIVVGRFWVDARQRANSFYGITSDRIVIVSGVYRRQSKSLSLSTLTDVTLSESSSGGGLITFGPTIPWFGWFNGFAWPGMSQWMPSSFELASGAREVYAKINEARSATRQRQA